MTGKTYPVKDGYLDLLGDRSGADNVANLTNFLPGAGLLYEPLWRGHSLPPPPRPGGPQQRALGLFFPPPPPGPAGRSPPPPPSGRLSYAGPPAGGRGP